MLGKPSFAPSTSLTPACLGILTVCSYSSECVYFGDIGKYAASLLAYFERHGVHCRPDANVAKRMLDAIGAGQAARIRDGDWADTLCTFGELGNVKAQIQRLKEEHISATGAAPAASGISTPSRSATGLRRS